MYHRFVVMDGCLFELLTQYLTQNLGVPSFFVTSTMEKLQIIFDSSITPFCSIIVIFSVFFYRRGTHCIHSLAEFTEKFLSFSILIWIYVGLKVFLNAFFTIGLFLFAEHVGSFSTWP